MTAPSAAALLRVDHPMLSRTLLNVSFLVTPRLVHHSTSVLLSLSQQDLMRQVKANEGSYLLYVQKAEQERASDALDARRIVNVAV